MLIYRMGEKLLVTDSSDYKEFVMGVNGPWKDGSWAVLQNIHGTLSLYILHYLRKLWKYNKEQILQLVKKGRPPLHCSFPAMCKPSEFRGSSLWQYYCQYMAKFYNISDNLRVFLISLVWRITLKLFNPLCVHRVYLDKFYFLFSQIMNKRFTIRPSRFKSDNNFFQVIGFFHLSNFIPKIFKAMAIILINLG